VFDINDFDEVSVAPWDWDVARLAASFVIAGRANGFREADSREAAWTAARSYRENMARYAEMPVLELHYESIDLRKLVLAGADEEMKKLNLKRIRKAESESAHLKEYTRLAVESGGAPRIRDEPPLIFHDDDLQRQAAFREMVERVLAAYAATLPPERHLLFDRYRLVDVAMKVVGVGSVGTYCGIALLVSGNGDPLFLQYKEARPSVLEPYCGRLRFGLRPGGWRRARTPEAGEGDPAAARSGGLRGLSRPRGPRAAWSRTVRARRSRAPAARCRTAGMPTA
jgi:uncharacterized protein (DUF2252 family)